MILHLWRPIRACAQHVRQMWLCAGFLLLFAAPAVADTIHVASYNSWRWGGFSRSSSTVSSSATTPTASQSTTPVSLSSAAWDTASSTATATSLIASALATSSTSTTTTNAIAYSAWQWNGFSSSTSPTYNASSTFALAPLIDTGGGGIGALSGFVYVDTNQNHFMDSADWAIGDAQVSLALTGSSNAILTISTGKDGFYSFDGLSAGTYTISMVTPCSQPGQDNGAARTILNKDGIPVSVGTAGTIVGSDVYSNVALSDGYTGQYFNFAENAYPVELISKRMVLNTDPGITHTSDITPVPEPGSLLLLAIAGLLLGGSTWRRWRRSG